MKLEQEKAKKKLIVFLDCGDTLIDEGSEVKDETGLVLRDELIPGAGEMVKTLAENGYTLALVERLNRLRNDTAISILRVYVRNPYNKSYRFSETATTETLQS